MSKIIQKQIDTYRGNFLKYGNTPLGTFQNNTATQYERFNQLLMPLLLYKPQHFSICDVGSGVCDLHKFLKMQNIKHNYTGIEIVQEMIETAKAENPSLRLLNQDILADDFQETFDFVVLSGTFNIPGDVNHAEWQTFILKVIEKMYKLCKISTSFNALTSYSTFRSNGLFYLNPLLVLDHIQKNMSRHTILNMNSPLYEVTYTIFKPEAVKDRFPSADFDKYF